MKKKTILISLIALLTVFAFMGCDLSGAGESDTTAPTVTETLPANSVSGVARNRTIKAIFSEAMNPATIAVANFTLKNGSTSVSGKVTYDIPTNTASFASDSNLPGNTTYTATVTTGVTDEAGNNMVANKEWSFTTAEAGAGPEPVCLGTAGNFAILAGCRHSAASDGDFHSAPTFLNGRNFMKITVLCAAANRPFTRECVPL